MRIPAKLHAVSVRKNTLWKFRYTVPCLIICLLRTGAGTFTDLVCSVSNPFHLYYPSFPISNFSEAFPMRHIASLKWRIWMLNDFQPLATVLWVTVIITKTSSVSIEHQRMSAGMYQFSAVKLAIIVTVWNLIQSSYLLQFIFMHLLSALNALTAIIWFFKFSTSHLDHLSFHFACYYSQIICLHLRFPW